MVKFYLQKLRESIGSDNPTLSQVLKWYSLKGRNKYSHFALMHGEAYFVIYDGEETYEIRWDLNFDELENQSEALIEWLAELIY